MAEIASSAASVRITQGSRLRTAAGRLKVRPLKSGDIPILDGCAKASGFEYPDLSDTSIEKILVVADDDGRPIVALAAKRLVELFAWFDPDTGAALRMEALDLLAPAMAESLKRLGYDCAEAFIPPQLERRGFGRFLMRHLGFVRNWPSFGKLL